MSNALKMFAALNPGGEFTPADISTALWLDASDSSTITHSSNAVSQWRDKSGNARHFSQGTAGVKPTTNTMTQNSLNVIDFAADYLTSDSTAATWNFLHNGTDYSIYAVVKFGNVADPNALYGLIGSNAGASGNIGACMYYDDRVSVPRNEVMGHLVANSNVGQFPVSHNSGNAFVTPNAYHLVQLNADPDNATAASRSIMTVDDVTSSSGNANTFNCTTNNATYVLQIGAIGNNAGPATCQIGELIIYSGVISAGNENSLINYLQTKWATP